VPERHTERKRLGGRMGARRFWNQKLSLAASWIPADQGPGARRETARRL